MLGAAVAAVVSGCSLGAGDGSATPAAEPAATATSPAAEPASGAGAKEAAASASEQSPQDAAYEPPALGEIVAGTPEGWQERAIGGLVLATPPGWEDDPDYGPAMVMVDGWLSDDPAWALHGPNPAKISVNQSVGDQDTFLRYAAQGFPVHTAADGTELVLSYGPLDDIVLGRHVSGLAAVRVPGSPDEYEISFTLPPDDASVEAVAGVLGSLRAAG
ncbi:hypothetical protein [Cellulosimicrobium sp. NPDC057127]|uniref:hypothetical protein n=1 Tax=Cellulosimicrobium sp. NPDC057127 TaxID=3346026 RepID=UPI003642CB5E